MRLPDGTGLDLLRRLDEAGRHEKAIVITAYGSAENAVEALKAGAYDYLTKPVDLRQFRAVVASALGPPARRAGAPPGQAAAARTPGSARATARTAHGAGAHRRRTRRPCSRCARWSSAWRAAWRRCWCTASRAPARNWWRAPSTTARRAGASRSSPSTAAPFPSPCSRPSSSATARAPSPAPTRTAKASSRPRRAARCSSTRSATCRCRCRASCCA